MTPLTTSELEHRERIAAWGDAYEHLCRAGADLHVVAKVAEYAATDFPDGHADEAWLVPAVLHAVEHVLYMSRDLGDGHFRDVVPWGDARSEVETATSAAGSIMEHLVDEGSGGTGYS